MTSTQLRRVTSRNLDDIVRQLNALIDRDLGNSTGRINLVGDGGLVKDLQGGTSTAANVPAIQVRPDSGEQFWMKHSNGSTTVLRGQDAGVTTSVPFTGAAISGTTGAFSSNVTVGGTLGVTGQATMVDLTTTGNTVLGNAVGDTVTISGPVTVGTTLTAATGVIVTTGGITVSAGGITVTGNSLVTGNLNVTGTVNKEVGGTTYWRMGSDGIPDWLSSTLYGTGAGGGAATLGNVSASASTGPTTTARGYWLKAKIGGGQVWLAAWA